MGTLRVWKSGALLTVWALSGAGQTLPVEIQIVVYDKAEVGPKRCLWPSISREGFCWPRLWTPDGRPVQFRICNGSGWISPHGDTTNALAHRAWIA
jgi:hypothetical protein